MIGLAADLAVTKVADVADPGVGDPVEFTVTVTNQGPNTTGGIEVADPSLLGIHFDSAAPSQGSWDDVSEIWDVGTLAQGESATLVIQATVESFCWGNSASVIASDLPDLSPDNDTDSIVRTEVSFWTGAGDGTSWSDPINWSAGVPGATTTACVNLPDTYTVDVDEAIDVRRLGFGGETGVQTLDQDQILTITLAEDSYLTETAEWLWHAGSLDGTGVLVSAAAIDLAGAPTKVINGTLVNGGTMVWSQGHLNLDGGVLENDGLIEAASNNTIDFAGEGGTFVNRATFVKTEGGSLTTIDVLVDLDGGTIQADNGTIALTRSGVFTNGTLTADADRVVDLESGTFEISGILGGDPEGVVRTSSAAILRPLDGVSASLGFGGTGLAWEAGTIQGPGRIVNSGLLEAKGAPTNVITGILENNATLLWSNGHINLDGGLLENDGLIEATGNHTLDFAGGRWDLRQPLHVPQDGRGLEHHNRRAARPRRWHRSGGQRHDRPDSRGCLHRWHADLGDRQDRRSRERHVRNLRRPRR